ncbi:MAG: hypothetical protein WA824_20085 [Candidatus Sulfotelmatobacter sp.]
MNVGLDDMEAIRQQILGLLRQQMEALDSPSGLTDDQLRECYLRQGRVQELREMLQGASISQDQDKEHGPTPMSGPAWSQCLTGRPRSAHRTMIPA